MATVYEGEINPVAGKRGIYQVVEWRKVEGVEDLAGWMATIGRDRHAKPAPKLNGKVRRQNGATLYRLSGTDYDGTPWRELCAVRVE